MDKNISSWQEQIDEIKRLYDKLMAIAIKQQQLIDSKDELVWPMDSVLGLQNERQDIMKRIDDVDRSGSAISLDNRQLPSVDQAVYLSKVEQIRSTIMEIQALDLSCQSRIELAMQKISSKLSQTRENKKAQLAYDQGDVYTTAWFFDKKQ